MHNLKTVLTEKDARRFWKKVAVASDFECWPWTGSLDKSGYGRFMCKTEQDRIAFSASRLAYFLHTNEDPGSSRIGHKCSLRRCCNPRCLFKISPDSGPRRKHSKSNNPDSQSSQSRPRTELVPADILEIRSLHQSGETCYALTKIFNVSWPTIKKIVDRKSWRHIL